MSKNTWRHCLVPLTTAVVLPSGAAQAFAVKVELLDLDDARNQVAIAILAEEAFDPKAVTRGSLVFGWSKQRRDGGFVEAVRMPHASGDVNGDGNPDRIAVFRLSDPDFQALAEGEVAQVEVSGDCGVAQGGSGGPPGYARTILVVSDLPDELWIYPGESGSNGGAGGAGTVLSPVDLVDLTAVQLSSSDPADLAATGILAIAGGGGGKGNTTNDNTECHHGGDGGAGGLRSPTFPRMPLVPGATARGAIRAVAVKGPAGAAIRLGTEGIGGPGGISYNEASGTGWSRPAVGGMVELR